MACMRKETCDFPPCLARRAFRIRAFMPEPPRMRAACLAALLWLLPGQVAAACVVDDATPGKQGRVKIHLDSACTAADREAHAVDASTLFAALKEGQTIDLDGVVVRGDLELEMLPVATNPPVVDGVGGLTEQEVRVIAGGVSIVNSLVKGRIVHRSSSGSLVFSGPLT